MHSDAIVVIVVATALAFDFTNGFHDTANVVATSISTRAMPPRLAVGYAAALNFVGAFISLEVAATVAQDVVQSDVVTPLVVFGALIGAIAWNLITWYFGLPSSSSHALIGGMVGAAFAADGANAILGKGLLGKVVIPGLVAPVLAFIVAGLGIVFVYRIVGRLRPGPVSGGFRAGQVVSGGLLALAHGTNDAQKTMGVITLALVANGTISQSHFHVPDWVVVSAATSIALGTYAGGWRIIRTMGSRIHKMDSAQGFAAQGAGATVILASSHVGFPLSTTHTISGAVIGSGAAKRLSAVRWGVAGNIVVAWVLTLPGAASIGALTYGVTRIFGTGAAGPLVVSALILAGAAVLFSRRAQRGPAVTAPEPGQMGLLAEIVSVHDLVQVIWVSAAAGVGVTAAFAFGILGAVRAVDLTRSGRAAEGLLFGVVCVAGLAAVAAAVVYGIVIMTHK